VRSDNGRTLEGVLMLSSPPVVMYNDSVVRVEASRPALVVGGQWAVGVARVFAEVSRSGSGHD